MSFKIINSFVEYCQTKFLCFLFREKKEVRAREVRKDKKEHRSVGVKINLAYQNWNKNTEVSVNVTLVTDLFVCMLFL